MRFSGIHATSQTVPSSLLPLLFQRTTVQPEHLLLLHHEAFPGVPAHQHRLWFCPLLTNGTDVTLFFVNAAGRVLSCKSVCPLAGSQILSGSLPNLVPTSCFSPLFLLCPHDCRYTECFSVLLPHHGLPHSGLGHMLFAG